MKLKVTLWVVLSIFCMGQWQGQAQEQQVPTDMVAPAIAGVVAGGTKVQLVKDGFKNTDGVVAMPDGSALFWDNDPVSAIYKVDNSGNVSLFLEHMRGTQGLGLDSKGRLIAVEHAPAAIAVIYPPGSEAVLASKFEGKPFNDPNDLVISTKGGIYFSVSNDHEVYYILPAGKVMLVLKDTVESRLNGLQLSPDEKTLYVTSQSLEQAVDLSTTQKQDGESLLAFDVQPDGTLRNRRVLAKYERMNQRPEKSPIRRGGDGLAIDSKGRIYAATAAGVQIFSPQGEHLGTIPVPRNPASLDFAGPDKKTLYIAARQGLYKVQMEAQGYKGRAK